MKNKGRLTVVLLFIITLLVIYMGFTYSHQQQAELTSAAEPAGKQDSVSEKSAEENAVVTDVSAFAEKRDQLSVLDYIRYIQALNGEASIAFYGQLPEGEEWVDGALSTLNEQLSFEVQSTNLTSPETDSYELYITNAAQELAATNAGVVFFFMPAEGDQVRDISLVDSADYLSRNITQIQEALPETLVVTVTASPNDFQSEDFNSRMLTYDQYVESGVDAVRERELPLFDLHTAFLEKLEEKQLPLESVLEEDRYTLNAQGRDLMNELFAEQLTIPLDTTSGWEQH